MPTPDMTDQYNTPLSPDEETAFQQQFPDPSDNFDYDMRGAYKAGATKDPSGHLPDTFKKPNHITFSDQSQYHGKDGYEGGQWAKRPNGTWSFAPGPTNLQHYGPNELSDYFNRVEKGNQLILPGD
jgi:hypothetical protein